MAALHVLFRRHSAAFGEGLIDGLLVNIRVRSTPHLLPSRVHVQPRRALRARVGWAAYLKLRVLGRLHSTIYEDPAVLSQIAAAIREEPRSASQSRMPRQERDPPKTE
jgi:hypothetical protein